MNPQQRSNQPAALRRLRQGGATSPDERAAAKLIEGYPLPPPDSATVQRIWRRVVTAPELQPSASRPRLLDLGLLAPVLALCCVVALGAVVLRGHSRPGPRVAPPVAAAVATMAPAVAELAAAEGGVFSGRPAQPWQPAREGEPLAEAQSLRTDSSGRALMGLPGIASILIARGTEVAIERLQGGTLLRLSRGSVVARVSKRPPSEPFVVLTRGFSVKVVGTLFQVDQDADDRTDVAVREGVVEVTAADGRRWQVGAGQRWSSGSPEQLGGSAIADRVRTLLEDELRRANPRDLDRELAEVDGAAAGAGADSASRGADATRGSNSAGTGSRATRETRTQPPLPPIVLAANEPEQLPESSLEPVPAPEAAPAPGAYADGLALERAGKVQAAAATFVQAEKSDPAHAAVALYALGRLKQHRLHDSQGALEAFETYRTRYPSGPLLPEVDLAILEIEVAAGHRDQALAESVRFLASHPASERIVEIHLLRGNLLRDRGDCRSALAEYRQVDAAAFAEEALFETAYCQGKLGDADAARLSLQSYRQHYPDGKHRDEVAKELRE